MIFHLLLHPQFEEAEKKRMKSEQLRQEIKHKKQWDTMKAKNEAGLKELEQLQVCVWPLGYVRTCEIL